MRQLDLFGSLIDIPQQKKEPEAKERISIKKETTKPGSLNEEVSYSLVELAEKMLGEETINDSQKIVEIVDINFHVAEQEENGTALSSSADKILQDNLAEINSIEQIQTFAAATTVNEDVEKEIVSPKRKEHKEPERVRNGAVIFEDGKITVKIKSKPVVTAEEETKTIAKEESKTTEKKEPQKRGRKSLEEIESEVDLIEVPEDEVLFQKQYYPISQVAKWFRVNTSLLRFWENEFEVLKPKKNRKGDRLFRPEDVKNLQLIYQLLRQRKYTIEGAKEYIKTHKQKADIQLQLTNTLQKFKNFLLDLRANL